MIDILKRYATTGDYPPNSSNGQAFVHDPKLEGDASVKATVRLRFTTSTGKPITATRVLELKQKAGGKQECHLLSAALASINDEGHPISHTLRCADIGSEVPQLMGVSKAILESVIFCHQEESNWPMQDGKKLKAKFDDIFAATRYTKALEELRKQRKALANAAKEQSLRLDTVRTRRDFVHKLALESQDLHAKNEATLARQAELKQLALRDQQALEVLEEAFQRGAAISERIRLLQARIDVLAGSLQSADALLSRFAHIGEPELQELASAVATDAQLAAQLADQEAQVDRLQQDLRDARSSHSALHLTICQSEAASLQRGKLLASRHQLLQEVAAQLSIAVPLLQDPSLADAVYTSSILEAQARITALEQAILEGKESLRQRMGALDGLLDEAKSQVATTHSLLQRDQADQQHHSRALETAQCGIRQQQQRTDVLRSLEAELDTAERALEDMERLDTDQRLNERLQLLGSEASSADARTVDLQTQLETLQQRRMQVMELSHLQEDRKRFLIQTQELLSQHPSLEQPVRGSSLVATAAAALESAERECATAATRRSELQTSCAMIRGQLQSQRSNAQQLETRQREIQERLRPLLSLHQHQTRRPASEILAALQAELQSKREDLSQTRSAQELYRVFIAQATDTHDCPLCGTSFGTPAQVGAFVGKLESFLASVEDEDLSSAQARLVELEARLDDARTTESLAAELEAVEQGQLPALYLKIETLDESLDQKSTELDLLTEAIEGSHQPFLRACRANLEAAHKLAELSTARQQSDEALQRKLDEMGVCGAAANAAADLDGHAAGLSAQSEHLRNERRRIERETQETREQLQQHHSELYQRRNRVADLRGQVLDARNSGKLLEECLQAEAVARAEIERLTVAVSAQTATLAAAKGRVEQLLKSKAEEESTRQAQLSARQSEREQVASKLASMASLTAQLKTEPNSAGGELEGQRRELQRLQEEEIPSMQRSLDAAAQALYGAKERAFQEENRVREARDVVRLRGQGRELQEAREEVEAERARLAAASTSLERDKAGMEGGKKQLELKREKIHNLEGRRYEFCQRIKQNERELTQPANKEVNEQYRRQLISLRTHQLAVDDLDRYHEALDKALMRYHTLKMQEINKIIKQLWQSTYQGKDIDTIEIRAEVPAGIAGTTARRSYNYRVVMIQGDTELDMNGRCSAGQKVLGSLVIRLALAETFCLSCGILALDEPTTNLDRRNVEGLAVALSQIINSRRYQRNFQLLVITHDEEFVQLLGRADLANYYLRVSRNSEHHTVISRRDIHDLSY